MMQPTLFDDPRPEKPYKGGYAGKPGGGPDGETCKTCEHYSRVHHHDKVYRKCGLMREFWTNGPGTDILAKAPACRRWEKAHEG